MDGINFTDSRIKEPENIHIAIVGDGRNIYQKAADECFTKGIEFPEELKCMYCVHQDICDGHMDLSLRKRI